MFCNRKRSEDQFLNRVEEMYKRDCILHYGDWSRKDQMKGCAPSLGVGMKRMLSKRFEVRGRRVQDLEKVQPLLRRDEKI